MKNTATIGRLGLVPNQEGDHSLFCTWEDQRVLDPGKEESNQVSEHGWHGGHESAEMMITTGTEQRQGACPALPHILCRFHSEAHRD